MVTGARAFFLTFNLFAALTLANTASADTFTVTNSANSGDGSLRWALIESSLMEPDRSTINFAPGLSPITISTSFGTASNATIDGTGATTATKNINIEWNDVYFAGTSEFNQWVINGPGTSKITLGATLTNKMTFFGDDFTPAALVSVEQGGTWNSTDGLEFGTGGGTLNVGGTLNTPYILMGGGTNDVNMDVSGLVHLTSNLTVGNGQFLAEGSNAEVNIDGSLILGINADSTTSKVTVTDGATLTSTGDVHFSAEENNASGQILEILGDSSTKGKVVTTGIVINTSLSYVGGQVEIDIDGGILAASANSIDFIRKDTVNPASSRIVDVILGTNGATIDTGSHDITIKNAISGSGGLIKKGSGDLTLTGNSSFHGASDLTEGQVIAEHSNALGDGSFTIRSGAKLIAIPGVNPTASILLRGGTYAKEMLNGAALSSYKAGSGFDSSEGGKDNATHAQLMAGTANADTVLETTMKTTSTATNDAARLSDVFEIDGLTDEAFVLQLSATGLGGAYVSMFDGTQWVLANVANINNTASGLFEVNSPMSFDAFLLYANLHYGNTDLNNFMGAYGHDSSTGDYWIVLNNRSTSTQYALTSTAVPEPGTVALLILGGIGLLAATRLRARRSQAS